MSFLFIRASRDIENNTGASPGEKLNYDITPISPGRDAIQSRSSAEGTGIDFFRRNVWLPVYCLGGETYKPIIPLFLRSLAENREKEEENGRGGSGREPEKKSVFHDPLSDVAGRRARSPSAIATSN